MHKMAEGRKESGLRGSEVLGEPEPVGDSHKAWGTTEEGDLEAVGGAVACGKGSRRRSALSAAGDRFSPGGSASSGATGDVEACLIEAAKATPRRSSIIKDSTRQKHEHKKTVSFSSIPSERKINSATDCISFMQAGCELKKIRSNTRIYSRFFTLDLDLQALHWEPSKKDPEKAKIDVSSLKEVRVGKNTETFRSCAVVDQICEDCSFSLIYGENYESLDLVASSADIANIWVTGLRYVTSHSKQALDLIEGNQNTLRNKWLYSVFKQADVDGNGIMLEDEAVKLIMQFNQGLKESKIRVKFREIQKQTGKLTTRVTKEEFTDVYCDLCTRPEVYFLLVQISGNKEYLDAKDLMIFLETEQGIINATEEMCLDLIRRYEPSQQGQMNGNLGIDGFTQYLISTECNIFDPEHNKVCQDMTQPLSHYYINASHNTYLTENIARSPSDLHGYIKALKLGCRSIELDVYDGPNEPIVSKRNNVTSPVSFHNVIKVINQYAFVASEYPLIICLRNHCSVGQQKVMAQKMKMIFGNKMFTEPPNSTASYLPSPEKLKRKIILKGKKLPQNMNLSEGDVTDEDEEAEVSRRLTDTFFVTKRTIHLCQELSDLVTLCQPAQFNNFHDSMKKQKYWEIYNFSEPEARTLANEYPEDFVNYNKRFLSRVYSGHLGLESSNLNPQEFWNCGCQIVTINYQTPGPMLDLNIGWFRQNGCCGYVLRPAIMRDEVSYFNAYTKGIVPGALPQVLHIKIISGQMFPKPKGSGTKGDVIDPYVYVEIRGIPADCAEMRTRTVHLNGENPIFEESFEFEINLPELVTVRFVALDDDYIGDEFIGQYTIPYECLQSGYRHIPLHSFTGEEIELATLFVHIATTDRRGGGKAHKRGYSVRKGKNTIKYTMLRSTGIKVVDDTFKIAGQPLREAADIRENVQNAIVSFKEICGLAPTANLTQCILTLSSRLQNNDSTSAVMLNMKDKYPYLEPFGTVSDVQKKVLSSYDLVIQETRYLIDVADTLHDKIVQCRKSGLEFHEEIHNLAKKEGLKESKLSKALESFAWNITVLKGQGDLLKNAKNEVLENMKQIQTACISCGLSKSGSGSAEMKSKQSLREIQKKENR
ncbi:inactive phospholipase C-like protein 1 [Carcharodon carcharias]|uniref:inactive phospholipase C-like protein 1 n=1 Tax=Carcharodon carcharias TaxID=13397 RepID=UPI001B7F0256|nr:inactive phospholipase C-like protein 1 [Carcharodon carcharias]XP_041057317.1 inactive phospholipase C-like protein 1 [Carcharodon carcharias]